MKEAAVREVEVQPRVQRIDRLVIVVHQAERSGFVKIGIDTAVHASGISVVLVQTFLIWQHTGHLPAAFDFQSLVGVAEGEARQRLRIRANLRPGVRGASLHAGAQAHKRRGSLAQYLRTH